MKPEPWLSLKLKGFHSCSRYSFRIEQKASDMVQYKFRSWICIQTDTQGSVTDTERMIFISLHCSVSIIIIIIILSILSTPDTAFWYSTRFHIIPHISLFTYVHYIRFYLPYGCCIITMWVSSLKCLDIFIIYFYSILENKTKIFFWSTLIVKYRLNPINTHTTSPYKEFQQ